IICLSYISTITSYYLFFCVSSSFYFFFFFNDPPTTEIYTLSSRRSSDLADRLAAVENAANGLDGQLVDWHAYNGQREQRCASHRSEEHTSELQSRRDLVCRLLLEKKNQPKGQEKNIMNRRQDYIV